MRKYSYIFADDRHKEIKSMADLRAAKRSWDKKFGFYLNGKPIGEASLVLLKTFRAAVHTEYVFLDKAYRRKGHGIWLYRMLIACAKNIGARKIYSSKRLNKYSRRMWEEKLPEFFEVKSLKLKTKCRRCGCQRAVQRYYIVLDKK